MSSCRNCGHPANVHSDRAIFPACEGAYDGETLPPLDYRYGYHKACRCEGFQ